MSDMEVLEERIASVKEVGNERDKRYEQRFEAQEKALGLALASSRGAIATAISILALLLGLISMFWRK